MQNQIVSHEEWLKARVDLLAAEKEFTRQRDALTRCRMAMPCERVDARLRMPGAACRAVQRFGAHGVALVIELDAFDDRAGQRHALVDDATALTPTMTSRSSKCSCGVEASPFAQ